jgi:hypothetical protein
MSEPSVVDEKEVMSGDEDFNAADPRFKVVNTVRSRHNRVQRMQHPVSARLKQHIGAGEHRVLRGRPLILTGGQIEKHLKEIGEKARMGLIQVQTMDGRIIDPESLRVSSPKYTAGPPQASVPVPNRLLDSANRDKNTGIGENIPQMPGGIPLAQVTSGNVTTGGIPGPLENEKGAPPTDPAAEGESEEPSDPAEG